MHSDAATAAETDWPQIVALYDQLLAFTPTSVVALNRAVAVAEVDGPSAGLILVDRLDLDEFYLYHAIRANLLRRLGRFGEARESYDAAIAKAENLTQRTFLSRARGELLALTRARGELSA